HKAQAVSDDSVLEENLENLVAANAQTRARASRNRPQRAQARPSRRTNPRASRNADLNDLRVSEISIKGNRKIENDAILARLTTKTGDVFSPAKIRQDVESLFALGYFYDVKVERIISS